MIDFIIAHWDSLLVVVLFILLVGFLLKRGAEKKVRSMLFYLVTEAEAIFGGGTGDLKYTAVVTWLYEKLPSILKILFTAKQIDKMIDGAVQEMKEYLDKNPQASQIVLYEKIRSKSHHA